MKMTDTERKLYVEHGWVFATQQAQAAKKREKQVKVWLRNNPEIGTLNSGMFYKIINEKPVEVFPPAGEY